MGWLISSTVIFLGLMFIAAMYLQGRFRYTRRSRLALAGAAPLALALGVALVGSAFRPLRGWPLAAVSCAAAVPIYLAMALSTVEVWRRVKLRRFDDKVRAVEASLAAMADELGRLEAASRLAARDGAARDGAAPARWPAPRPAEVASIDRDREAIDRWVEQGGAARVRGLLAAEWEREFQSGDASDLERTLRALEDDLGRAVLGRGDDAGALTAEERRERATAMRARLAVGRLELARRGRGGAAGEATGATAAAATAGEPGSEESWRRRGELREAAADSRQQLDDLRRLRADFLRQRILLD